MVYTPQTWANLPTQTTPLSASRMQHIEDGIADLGVWTTFTPSWTNITVGNGTVTGRYAQIGKTVYIQSALTFGSSTSVSGSATLAIPVNRAGTIVSSYGLMYDASAATVYHCYPQASSQTLIIRPALASGTYVTYTNTSSTVPFTWAVDDQIVVGAIYEAA